ncbi:MAG TPA: LysR substrate-binding domain-containing protein [Rhizobiaceae bacterium]
MHRNRLPLHALRAFAVAARHGSLIRAADELSVTHGAISHQIRSLEEQLNVTLFDRKKRPMQMTTAGEQLLISVEECLDRLQMATNALQSGQIEGQLTISCVPGIASNWLVPNLGAFLSTHVNIAVHVVTQHWQHPTVTDRCDLALAYGSAEYPGKRVVLLGLTEFFPVCSPELVGRTRPIREPQDIMNYTLLHEYSDETWSRWFAVTGVADVKIARRVYFDGANLSLQAARAGYGIAMGDMATVKSDLADGRLVRLFDESVPAAFPYYLIAAPRSEQSAAARAMEEWLIETFAAQNGSLMDRQSAGQAITE